MCSSIISVVAQHGKVYPQMLPQDVFKLLYQSQFGPGHLIDDPAKVLHYFDQEWENCEETLAYPLFEDIGNGFSRLHLGAAKAMKVDRALVFQLFCASAQETGSTEEFVKQIQAVITVCNKKELPFSGADFSNLLQQWEEDGHPHYSHTAQFRNAYHPAYRVVKTAYSKIFPLLCAIQAESRKKPIVVAIDGPCGSGKTTLSNLLVQTFKGAVVRMDHFFLPQTMRTPERLAQPGGNLHAERFAQMVLPKLKSDKAFDYMIFDCMVGDFTTVHHVEASPVTIVEGVYSMSPAFREAYDITVFCQIDPEMQKQRIIARNGEQGYEAFANRWIPLEEHYFSAFAVADACQFKITT